MAISALLEIAAGVRFGTFLGLVFLLVCTCFFFRGRLFLLQLYRLNPLQDEQ